MATSERKKPISFEERIRTNRRDFPPSFQRLGEFLLDSYPQAALMTATELAHALDLDPGTVVRFAQKLGYPGYPELQRDLRNKLKKELLQISSHRAEDESNPSDLAFAAASRCIELARRGYSIQASEELINALDVCERILLFAEESALPAASGLANWLSAAGYTILLAPDNPSIIARTLAGAHPMDLVLAIETSSKSPFLTRTLKAARRNGLKTAAFVASPSSRTTDEADIILSGYANQDPALQQMLTSIIVHVFIQMLRIARPLRFQRSIEETSRLNDLLIEDAL